MLLVTDDSIVLDIPNTSEDSTSGQAHQRPLAPSLFPEDRKYEKRADIYSPKYGPDKDTPNPGYTANQGNIIVDCTNLNVLDICCLLNM